MRRVKTFTATIESRFYFCGKHPKQEIDDYQSQPEKRQRINGDAHGE